MSLDRSLKSANALVRHRNVLTRAERLERLKEEEKWTEAKSVFNLPKVANRKMEVGGKADKAEAATEGAATTPGTAAAATAAAPGAKGAAGAAKTTGAAPAAAGGKASAAPAKAAAAPAAGAKKK